MKIVTFPIAPFVPMAVFPQVLCILRKDEYDLKFGQMVEFGLTSIEEYEETKSYYLTRKLAEVS